MPVIVRSALVEKPASILFDLVDSVEQYPDFLPWCTGATVLQRNDDVTIAKLTIGMPGINTAFTTKNRKVRPTQIDLELVEGPFSALKGAWRFMPLGAVGEENEQGCKVELSLEYTFASPQMNVLMGRVFEEIARTMIDRFIARAMVIA